MEYRGEVLGQLTWEFRLTRCFYQVHKYWVTPKEIELPRLFEEWVTYCCIVGNHEMVNLTVFLVQVFEEP